MIQVIPPPKGKMERHLVRDKKTRCNWPERSGFVSIVYHLLQNPMLCRTEEDNQ